MKTALSYLDARHRSRGTAALPEAAYWLAVPPLRVFGEAADAEAVVAAVSAALARGLEPATVEASPRPDGTPFAAAGDAAAASPNAKLLEGGAGAAALALRLGIGLPRAAATPAWWVPKDWLDRAAAVLRGAGDDELLDALGGGGDVLGRAIGATMKRGLVDVCSEAAALYVWDQCVLSSFDGVLPAAAAALLLCVRDGAAKESEIPNFKGSYLGRFPLVSADFWTSDHLPERFRRVDAFYGTRLRGTLTFKRC